MSPCHDLQSRIGRPPLLDDLPGLERIGNGDNEAARRNWIGRGKNLG
jgi:hypothetical protein